MSIKIILTLNLGNDAMLSDAAVGSALEEVASRFRDARYVQTVMDEGPRQGYSVERGIMDHNGNTVGDFTVAHVDEEDDSCTHDNTYVNDRSHCICSECGMDLGR